MKSGNIFTRLAATDRKQFAQVRKLLQQECRKFPAHMVEVEVTDEEASCIEAPPVRAWRSKGFFAAEYHQGDDIRITINRTEIDNRGQWLDGITWDDIQRIKSEIGYDHLWAVEVFPPDDELVDVANMRHIFLCQKPDFAWAKEPETTTAPDMPWIIESTNTGREDKHFRKTWENANNITPIQRNGAREAAQDDSPERPSAEAP